MLEARAVSNAKARLARRQSGENLGQSCRASSAARKSNLSTIYLQSSTVGCSI